MSSSLSRCAQSWEQRLREAALLPLVDPREPPSLTKDQTELVNALIDDLRPRLRLAEPQRNSSRERSRFIGLTCLGVALLHRGRATRRYGPALRVLSDAVDCLPSAPSGYRLRGQAYFLQGMNHPKWMHAARQDLRRALLCDSGDDVALLAYSLSYDLPARQQHRQGQDLRRRGQARRATRHIVNAEKGFEQTVLHLTTLLDRRPDHGLARLARGSALALLGQLTDALGDFDHVHRLGADAFDVPLSRRPAKLAELHLERGRVLAPARGDRALAEYDRALEYLHDSPDQTLENETRLARAALAQRTGRHGLAIEDLSWAIERQIEPPIELLLRRAQCHHAAADEPQARADAARILAVEPNHVEARFLRGSCNLLSGSFMSALADFDWCLATRPDLPDCRRRRADVLRALGQHPDRM
jgi:tetratricopeptide (TPR) repeat protein